MDEVFTGHFPEKIFNLIEIATTAIASSAILTSVLSITRNIKRKNFIGSSVICRIIRWCWRIFVKAVKWFYGKMKSFKKAISYALSQKTVAILISMLFAYTAIIVICCLFTFLNFILFALWIMIGFGVFGFACFIVSNRAKDIDEIRKGADAIRNGNLDYKIPELKCSDLKELAENINEIGEGLEKSVSAQVKAERLKTDLITNVSHDLKTPLTSIISYTELLSKVEGLPEEAKDYAAVIAKKSDRLKNLTQDLFDISKVQSGNENIVFEKLDAALLISQSLAERDNEIKASELNFCVKADKELYFSADGRKMSRVVGNLIDNAVKYSLKGTRVFVSAFEKDDKIVIELKNTSAYPLDFDAEEITGRFVRGDESRTDGGNGLGLAIAKSYTEVCGGKFDVILDGDMFKAIIEFGKY